MERSMMIELFDCNSFCDSVIAHLALIVALRELYNTSSVELTENMYSPVQTDKLQVVLGQSRCSQRVSNDSIQ